MTLYVSVRAVLLDVDVKNAATNQTMQYCVAVVQKETSHEYGSIVVGQVAIATVRITANEPFNRSALHI